MWALYADENKGCCIELEVTSKTWKSVDVKYQSEMPNVNNTVEEIITTKSKEWEPQQEVRFLRRIEKLKSTRRTMRIKIKRILFGLRVQDVDYRLCKKLISRLNPNIKVERLKWRNSALGYEQ